MVRTLITYFEFYTLFGEQYPRSTAAHPGCQPGAFPRKLGAASGSRSSPVLSPLPHHTGHPKVRFAPLVPGSEGRMRGAGGPRVLPLSLVPQTEQLP